MLENFHIMPKNQMLPRTYMIINMSFPHDISNVQATSTRDTLAPRPADPIVWIYSIFNSIHIQGLKKHFWIFWKKSSHETNIF